VRGWNPIETHLYKFSSLFYNSKHAPVFELRVHLAISKVFNGVLDESKVFGQERKDLDDAKVRFRATY